MYLEFGILGELRKGIGGGGYDFRSIIFNSIAGRFNGYSRFYGGKGADLFTIVEIVRKFRSLCLKKCKKKLNRNFYREEKWQMVHRWDRESLLS